MTYLSIKKKNKKAFSLVEILVSIALLAVVMLGINRVYIGVSSSQKELSEANFLKADVEYFFKKVTNNLKRAEMGDGNICSVEDGSFFYVPESLDSISFIVDENCLEFYRVGAQGFNRVRMYNSEHSSNQLITSSKTNVLDLLFYVMEEPGYLPAVVILIKVAPRNDSNNYSYFQTSVSLEN
jgi:prepilin-type N-terminal cleavage/methylation domain-containing protein